MSAYDWPLMYPFCPEMVDMWLENVDVTERSLLGGGQQTAGRPGAHWRMALTFPVDRAEVRQELLGFLRKLNGKEHRVRLWDLRKYGLANAHGYPAGTISTSGVTVKASVAQFGTSLVLQGCGDGGTLLPGDMFSVNGQLVENCELATADEDGDMTVLVPQRLRAQAAANAPVTLVRPTALFVVADTFHGQRAPTLYEPMTVEFEEVFA